MFIPLWLGVPALAAVALAVGWLAQHGVRERFQANSGGVLHSIQMPQPQKGAA